MTPVGIETTKTLAITLAQLASAAVAAKADGKIGFEDIGLLMPIIPNLIKVLENVGGIPDELEDMDQSEKQQVIAAVKTALVLGENEELIEDVIAFAIASAWNIYAVYRAVAELRGVQIEDPVTE